MNDNIIRIEIESELEPIVPEFLANRKNDCILIENLLSNENFGEIRTLGHRMKGAGGSYGFDEISIIGEAIEDGALIGDHESIKSSVKKLSDYLLLIVPVYV